VVSATGTYYFPVSRLADETVIQIALTGGLTITSVSWTTENVRSAPGPLNVPGNAVAVGDAQWTTIAADADGSYRILWPIDTFRVIVGGTTGTATISALQAQADYGGN